MSLLDKLQTNSGRAEKIDATPRLREVFMGYTHSGYSFIDALAEYIDNSFQQGLKQKDPAAVKIDVKVKADGPIYYVDIKDNAGGAKRSDAVNFIRPGASGNDASSDSFGLFGVGGKVAGLSCVSKAVIIVSKAYADPGFWVKLDKADIDTRLDWQFDVMPFPENFGVLDGQTEVILYGVPPEVSVNLTYYYLFDYQKRYAYLLMSANGKVPKIYLNDIQVTPYDPINDMLNEKEAPDGCKPKTYTKNKSINVSFENNANGLKEIKMIATIGLRPSGSTIGESGAAIYCNDRLIERHSQLALYELFDTKDSIVHPGSDKAWINAVVRINGPANLMPWTTRKDSLNSSSSTYPILRDFLKEAYEDFLEKQIGPAREALRSDPDYRRGKLYVSDILINSYARKLKAGDLHKETVRPVILNSQSFAKAITKTKGKIDIVRPIGNGKIVNLSGSVEREKLENARRLVESENGSDNITNTDLVRYMVEHIIKCLGGPMHEEAEKLVD